MGVRLKRLLIFFRKRVRMDNNFSIYQVGMVKQRYTAVITDKEY